MTQEVVRMHMLFRSICWLVALYVLYCGLLFALQRRMMYPRHLVRPQPIGKKPAESTERIWLDIHGDKIEAWFLPRTDGGDRLPAPVVIMAHGNGELIDFLPDEFGWLTSEGLGLLLVEYPGYGRSQGNPSEQHIADTFLTAYDMLIERPDVAPDKIVLLGRSLGGGPICALADKRPSAALILISTFTSTRSFAAQYLAPAFLIRDVYDNLPVLRNYMHPVLIMHGTLDKTVPYRHAPMLCEAAQDGTLISYECGHDNCPPNDGQLRRDLLPFLASAGVLETPFPPPAESHGRRPRD